MKIIHNISLNVDKKERKEFLQANIQLEYGLVTFQITEDDPRWEEVKFLANKFDAVDIPLTKFDLVELNAAKFLDIRPSWHNGYPMPDEDGNFREVTYDLSNYCKKCGIGKKQKAPFRIKKAPKWGNKSIFQLNWIFDEYFVNPDIWENLLNSCDIEYRPVLLNKTKEEINSVIQIDVQRYVDLDMSGYDYATCNICDRIKYLPVSRSFYPKPQQGQIEAAIFKSNQYFGSGAAAFQAIIVTQKLYREIQNLNYRGVTFAPCKL